ncbi:hypothetical protein PAPHI01_1271 [Pancytospora philotis]|nr:hypothetical protein PAPHI01_1271 [Pancytospora philotis]
MPKPEIEEALVEQCCGRWSCEEAAGFLEDSGVSRHEYNGYIMQLLGRTKTLLSANPQMRIKIGVAAGGATRERDERAAGAQKSRQLMQNMNEFYGVDGCPSFLYHGGLLAPEDISYAIEVYAGLYGLEYSEDPRTVAFMHDFLVKHARELLEQRDEPSAAADCKKMHEK